MPRAFQASAVGASPLLVWLVGYALARPAEFYPWGEWSLMAALFVSAYIWLNSAIASAANPHPSLRVKALCIGPFIGFHVGLMVALSTGWHQPRWLSPVSLVFFCASIVWPYYMKERRPSVGELEQRETRHPIAGR